MLSTCVAKFVPKLSCLQDLKLDKLQHFVLDECDKCLDKVDMRKDRTQSAVASLHPQGSRETLAGCPANLYGFAQERSRSTSRESLFALVLLVLWSARIRWLCSSQVMMFSATMSAETRALCKKSQSLTREVV